MYDSPIDHCPVCKQMVVLDQTRVECQRAHHCSKDVSCPLESSFTSIDFSAALSNKRLYDKIH